MNENWWMDTKNFRQNLYVHPRSEREWDIFFMQIAGYVSKLSKCSSRKVGSILVKDKDIISMGFNGAPAGSNFCQESGSCPRKKLGIPSGQRLDLCPAQHSEENTVARAAKKGIATEGSTLYCWCPLPCQRCAGALINAGVKRVVCFYCEKDYDDMSKYLFDSAGVEVYKYTVEEIMQEMQKTPEILGY